MATTEATAQTLLAALVSGRCYPLTAPDPVTKPYIIYSVISDVQENGIGGFAGISNQRMQVDAYATSYGAVKTLAASIKTAMSTAAFTNIHLSSQDLHESDTQLYRISMDFSIWS
jgi:hypothetical protein